MRQTVKAQIRYQQMQCLIRVYTICIIINTEISVKHKPDTHKTEKGAIERVRDIHGLIPKVLYPSHVTRKPVYAI